MARQPLYEKNELKNRTVKDTKAERDRGYARIMDYKNRNNVELFWDFSEQSTKDGVFLIKIGKEEAVLDTQQMMKYLRWV
jgi:hypothetical protein